MLELLFGRTAARRVAPSRRSVCEFLEPRRLFAAGDLDTSFDGDGDASTAVPGVGLTGRDVAVQADGKTVVVGYADAADGFAVTRYNLNGTPDTTFGPDHNGTVVTRFGGDAGAAAVAIQPDGKIVVLGSSDVTDTRVVRYNPDGGLDRTFGGGDGHVVFDPVGLTEIANLHKVILQPDGKILLGGSAVTGVFDSDSDFIFVRLHPDGSFDGSFDGDGIKVLGFGGEEQLDALAIDYSGTPATNPDHGKIVVAGHRFAGDGSSSTLLMTRLTPNGGHDTTYDGDGRGVIGYPGATHTLASGVVIQDDGRIVVGGHVDRRDFMLVRFLRSGGLDTSFGAGGTGWVRTDMGGVDFSTDLIAAPSGGLILGGQSDVPVIGGREQYDAIAYYTPDGRPDTRIGGDGTITYRFGGDVALAAGPGRRFVFAGGPGMHAARFLDVGANVVYAATLNSVASETGPAARGFFVYRTERVPFATRVYFNVGGTATPPANPRGGADYSSEGLVFPISFPGFPGGPPYVDIPANATFAVATITPIDDTTAEGNETAVFTIRTNAAYEVGDPGGVTLTIVDNDAPPPTVAQVFVRGHGWRGTDGDALNTTFKEYLAVASLGDAEFGYRVDNLPAGSTLPWTNVNHVVLRYSSPPTGAGIPTAGGVTLDGVRSDYAVTSVAAIDPRTFLLTLDRAMGVQPGAGGANGDRVALTVAGGGANGTAYALLLNTLQGDADRAGGRVTALDLSAAKTRANRTATEPPPPSGAYTAFADVNTDGRVNALDLSAVKARLNDALPTASAPAALAFAEWVPPLLPGESRELTDGLPVWDSVFA